MHLLKNQSCKEIVDHIQKGGSEREKGIAIIYRQCFHLVRSRSKKFGLDYDLVMGEYTETILIFDDRVRAKRFEVRNANSCLNFIMRTLDLRCLNLRRKLRGELTTSLEEIPFELEIANEEADELFKYEDLWKLFLELKEKCQKVLIEWLSGYSMEEIAERNELSNANAAAVTNNRCKNSLKEILLKKGYIK